MSTTAWVTERHIPSPAGEREPLRANLFERMVGANCQLIPLFPYFGPGAIVPCGAIMNGAPSKNWGHFFHYNTVAEVVLTFGARDAMLGTGQMYATQPLHGVNSFLRSPEDPEAFLLLTITQRQPEGIEQTEAVVFRCHSCNAELLRHEYSGTPQDAAPGDMLPSFSTLEGSHRAVAAFTPETARTCAECGEVSGPFPLEAWGWDRWTGQLATVNRARRTLDAHVSAMTAAAPV